MGFRWTSRESKEALEEGYYVLLEHRTSPVVVHDAISPFSRLGQGPSNSFANAVDTAERADSAAFDNRWSNAARTCSVAAQPLCLFPQS